VESLDSDSFLPTAASDTQPDASASSPRAESVRFLRGKAPIPQDKVSWTALSWCVTAFNVSMLFLVLTILLHAGDRLRGLLDDLDTIVGSLAYLGLWAIAFFTHWWGLRWFQDNLASGHQRWWPGVSGFALGAATGASFLIGVAVVLLGVAVAQWGIDAGSLLGGTIFTALAALIAAVVGGTIGVVFAALLHACTVFAVRLAENLAAPPDSRKS
jgi:hypothetical protein